MNKNYTCHVISHTHWDREWYQPLELFRLRLVDLIDRLLDMMESDPEFRFFNLDGQGIVLEDYLRLRPGNEQRLKALISEGRITIGPWYVLNDEFLVSGESTVRSLLIGHRVVSRFGPVMKIGYLPDQFGNMSQMPQILRSFGIDNCIFGRGWQAVDGRNMEFEWRSPDGSSVLSSLMWFWYNNAQDIPAEAEAGKAWFEALRNRMAPVSGSSHLLFMNGVDHLEAQYNLSKALAAVNPAIAPDRMVHSTLPQYIEALRKEREEGTLSLESFTGELREDRWASILAGVLSARVYLKQANERSMRVLEKFAEPLAAVASTQGAAYPAGELDYAWKLLLENHPHDSICGCSLDEVHDEMMMRFGKIEQLGGALRDRAMRHIAEQVDVDGLALVVFNTLGWARADVVEAQIEIPLGPPDRAIPGQDAAADWPALEILDPEGKSVPYTLLSSDKFVRGIYHPEKLPMVQWVRRFKIEFVAAGVPPAGYSVFRLRRAERMPDFGPPLNSMQRDALFAETGAMDVSPGSAFGYDLAWRSEDKSIYLTCLSSLEDSGDVGDEYNYRKPDRDIRILSRGAGEKRFLVEGPVSVAMETRSVLRLPESAAPGRKSRSERTVDCPVTLVARAFRGIERVELELTIENRAKDHRLRALFPTEAEGAAGSVAGGAFDAIERPLHLPADWPASPPPSPFHPMDGWVDVSNGERGLAVLVDGLREYELYDDDNRTLGVTVLRSVGVLAGGGEIPYEQATPGAQCLGTQTARYAVLPHAGDWKQAKVWKEALNYQVRLQAVQVGDLDRARSIEPVTKGLPLSVSFAGLEPDSFVLSALKAAEDGSGIAVRFFNILPEDVTGRVTVRGAKRAWMSNMAEERLSELALDGDAVSVTARGREIVTLLFEV